MLGVLLAAILIVGGLQGPSVAVTVVKLEDRYGYYEVPGDSNVNVLDLKPLEKLAVGAGFFHVESPPIDLLAGGNCLESRMPRIMMHWNEGTGQTYSQGVMEACMRTNCNFEVGERGILPPSYSSDTAGLGTNCFLKLQERGGVAIFSGDPANPILVKTLIENENLSVYGPESAVGYEIYLEDYYLVQKSYELEYEPDRFTKNPSLILRRLSFTFFKDDFQVHTVQLATLPDSSSCPDPTTPCDPRHLKRPSFNLTESSVSPSDLQESTSPDTPAPSPNFPSVSPPAGKSPFSSPDSATEPPDSPSPRPAPT